VPKDDPVFKEAVIAERSRQADPGPRGPGHGVSQRPAGAPLGRHARTHQKKHAGGHGGGGHGGGHSGGGHSHSSGGSSKPSGQVVFSGSPRGRR
jgi:hypothetical protein